MAGGMADGKRCGIEAGAEPRFRLRRNEWRLRCAALGACPECVECSDSALGELRQAAKELSEAA